MVAAGVRWDVALVFWTAYLVIAIIATRVVSESGLLAVQPDWEGCGRGAQLFRSQVRGPGWRHQEHGTVSFLQNFRCDRYGRLSVPASKDWGGAATRSRPAFY